MRTLLFLLLLTPTFLVLAQQGGKTCNRYEAIIDSVTNKVIYTSADIMPVFVDSTLDFNDFFSDNLKMSIKKDEKFKINVSFVVEPNGEISNKKINIKPDCDNAEEIMDVLDNLPPMKPGKIGKAVVPILMEYTIIISN